MGSVSEGSEPSFRVACSHWIEMHCWRGDVCSPLRVGWSSGPVFLSESSSSPFPSVLTICSTFSSLPSYKHLDPHHTWMLQTGPQSLGFCTIPSCSGSILRLSSIGHLQLLRHSWCRHLWDRRSWMRNYHLSIREYFYQGHPHSQLPC